MSKQKHIETNMKRYGVRSPLMLKAIREKSKEKRIEIRYQYLLNNSNDLPLFPISDFGTFNDTKYRKFKFRCKRCGGIFESYIRNNNGIHDRCPNCFKHNGTSDSERELYEFMESVYHGTIIRNTKKIIYPLELDIFLPEKKLAFEYDGLYWHSDIYKDKNYHITKTNRCAEKGIRLVHVFENEWINHKE